MDKFQSYVNAKMPLMELGQHHIIHEGEHYYYHTLDGRQKDGTPREHDSGFEISRDRVPEMGLTEIQDVLEKAAAEMATNMSKHLFSVLDEDIQSTGNMVDANGKQFSPQLLLDAFEKIDLEFDENGEPHYPQLIVGPDLADYIKLNMKEWEKNEEFTKRLSEIILIKKEEWYDRESDRALVD